jgi:hypothetical protein
MTRRSYSTLSHGSGQVFRASALQREYRRVLDCARESPVQVLDKDDTLLGIERWDDLVFAHGMLSALEEIGQFHAIFARHREEGPADWAAMTPFPWLSHFDGDDAAEFAGELLPRLFESLRRGSLDPYLGAIRAWESSTELLDDAEMVAALNVDLAGERLVEIFPPSPEEVAAAEEASASG